MGRLVAIVLAAAAVLIVVLAVNGSGKDKPEKDAASTPTRESPRVAPTGSAGKTAAAHAQVGATVRMRRLAFSTPVVTVRRGQAVRFVNRDDVAHTVLQDIGARGGQLPLFESPRILPGGSYEWVASAVGTYRYVCSLHPSVMHGQIVVTGGA